MNERRGGLVNGGVIAHNGLGDWILQRITAVILVLYTVIFVAIIPFVDLQGFDSWKSLFGPIWMKLFTIAASVSLIYHAWVGIREIWMDYIKPVGVKIGLQVFSIIWLLGCGIWIVTILLRI